MADPFTLAAISIGTSVVGGGIAAAGAMGQGQAGKAEANYRAGIAQVNSKVDKQNAAWALESGGIEALKAGQKTGFQIAQTRADQAASGVDINTGSPAAVVDSERLIGNQNATIIRNSAARRAYGFNIEAASKDAESTMDIVTGSNVAKAGETNALTSVLSTASSVSSKWLQGSQAGIFASNANNDYSPELET